LANSAELYDVGHALATLPRKNMADVISQDRQTKRFLCGHPGCALAFGSKRACEQHQREAHVHSRRLAVATPEQDQFLRGSWPGQMPWEREDQLAAKEVHRYACPICAEPLATRAALRRHLQFSHKKQDVEAALSLERGPSSAAKGGPCAGGAPRKTPPFPPPRRAPLSVCLRHNRPSFRCADCTLAGQYGGPEAPMAFYPEVVVRCFTTLQGVTSLVEQKFNVQSERTPYFVDDSGHERSGQLFAVCVDASRTVWVALALFWSSDDLRRRGFEDFPLDFDRANEVLEDACVTYMRADRIAGYSYNVCCDKAEWGDRKKLKDLPRHPKEDNLTKFSCRIYDSARNRLGPARVLDSDADPNKVGIVSTFKIDKSATA